MDTQVIYRLSDNGYKKPKFDNATKKYCLENAIDEFGFGNIHLFIDETNLLPTTRKSWESNRPAFANFNFYTGGSSAASWRHVLNYALSDKFKTESIIYMLEDDYLHLPNSETVLKEGMEIAHYVSLYDHNDKYIPASKGGNAYVGEDGGEVTKVFRTKSTHWKLTNSTTMTFATTKGQLLFDKSIWDKYTQGSHPNDFAAFIELQQTGRSLITPIPGYSTHCEPQWASPGIDWSKV